MTEDAFVGTRVREFAENINCDPELAQELYFQHKVSLTLDNEQKTSIGQELEVLQNVSKSLDKAAKALSRIRAENDQLQTTLKIQGLDLKKQVSELNDSLKEHVDFFEDSFVGETSGTSSDHKANTVAEFVAAVFLATNRSVGFGTQPNDSSEPSTPFGRAVRAALTIFKVYRKPNAPHLTPEIAHWKRPAERAAKGCQKPN